MLEEILNQGNHKTQDMFKRYVGVCMNQMTAKAGIKKHRQTAITIHYIKGVWTTKWKDQISKAMRSITAI